MEAWAEYRYVPDRFNNNIRCIEIQIKVNVYVKF